jgi:hypothetical protein
MSKSRDHLVESNVLWLADVFEYGRVNKSDDDSGTTTTIKDIQEEISHKKIKREVKLTQTACYTKRRDGVEGRESKRSGVYLMMTGMGAGGRRGQFVLCGCGSGELQNSTSGAPLFAMQGAQKQGDF